METTLRKAVLIDQPQIWEILKGAIDRRKADGSNQWQDGYPNPEVVKKDIENQHGFVLEVEGKTAGYVAILINDEPEYAKIKGNWKSNGDFVVYHRVAISEDFLGKGLAQKMLRHIEDFALDHNIHSLKVDTNFDNFGMLKILEKSGYEYCGEVTFRGSARKAFEKVLK